MNAYLITWKRHPYAKTLHTWTRFAPDDITALLSAAEAIANETADEGVLVSVEPTADPRSRLEVDPLDAIEPDAAQVQTDLFAAAGSVGDLPLFSGTAPHQIIRPFVEREPDPKQSKLF